MSLYQFLFLNGFAFISQYGILTFLKDSPSVMVLVYGGVFERLCISYCVAFSIPLVIMPKIS